MRTCVIQRVMYWADKEFKSDEVRESMTLKRFLQIEKYMRLYSEREAKRTGESDQKSPNYDPNYKVAPCWKSFFISAQANKNPSQDMVIDEQIVATKVTKQYTVLQNACSFTNFRNGQVAL